MLSVLRLYDGYIHAFTISLFSYFFMKYTNSAWTNFIIVMASMCVCHIGRILKGFEGDTDLDYSGAMMILTIKLSSFGFNVLDGRLAESKNLSAHNQQMKISSYPSFIQYFGWVFFFPGFLAGPTCEYMDYIRFIETRVQTSTWKPALMRLSKSFAFIAALVYLGPTYNFFQALQPAWSHKSFWSKIFFIQLSAFLTRCKYYTVWYLSEGASILAGMGFNGYDQDGHPKWNRLTNVNVLYCEFAQSYKQLSENWNIGANHWLRHYVYLRSAHLGATGSTLLTYVVSAMWHGFHPGFYIFFMTLSVLQLIARQVRRTVRPFFLTVDGTPKRYWKTFYDVCTWATSFGLLNMLVPCFDLLYVSRILHIWRQIYYCHFIVIVIGTGFFYALKPSLRQIQKKRVEKYLEQQKDGKKIN
ncbi:lysophospholipid acyltransferase [Rhizopus azygosporus]|uniref:Lysophospholipid acyltransferase n=2 Tax=Rhizopus TaxID=4842 RepID=A0A367K6G9_RHIAZ|nr:lysophospholipid acyltransferase [Rhizopus azygosporus]